MKKECLSPLSKELNQQSDTELIDLISETLEVKTRETAKALLNKRLMRVIDDLKETTKDNNLITSKYNRVLISLTWVLVLLTIMIIIQTFYK